MKKSPAFAFSITFAMIALFFGMAPDARAAGNTVRTVYATSGPAQDCTASLLNQYSPSATNLCWSGTNASNYKAFSLQALQAGVETFPLVTNTTPTLELYNDTSSNTVSVKLVGNLGSNQPITCQGTTGSTGCEISGPAGTFNSQTSPDSTATYPAASSTAPWPAAVTITFFGVPMNSYVGLQWASWTGVDQTGISFGGQVANYASAVSSCGVTPAATTVKGVVYAPNGVDPLPNALVYVPASAPGALTSGTQCLQASAIPGGGVITSTVSAADGTFTLTGVPAGASIPIIIQVGKWRIQRTIATVASCGNTPLPASSTTLPSNQFAGDIPKIALVTGSEDAIQCVLRKTGVLDSEFTNNSGTGRINLFLGGGNPGSRIDPSTPGQEALVGNSATLGIYDIVMLPSQGAIYPQTPSDLANIYQWANIGGRLFASHDSVSWLANNPLSGVGFGAAAQWDSWQASASADSASATVNSSFPGGSVLSSWLGSSIVNPSNAPVTLPTAYADQLGVVAPTQSWLSLDVSLTPTGPAHPSMQFTFNTPVGATAENQCGRVLYTEYPAVKTNANGSTFPAECSATAMTTEEHLVEYSLFDLSNAITPVVAASVSQTFTNSPSSFKQGDSADQVTIAITNTSSAVALGSTLIVNGTLPSSVTVNTAHFVSGGWSCASQSSGSAFTCTRSNSLAANATDPISIPVAVAATASAGTSASITDIVSGGGLPSPVAGSDTISITGMYSSICSAAPCTTVHANTSTNGPLGIANAYNLIALKGDISDAADITGRIAAAGQVTLATTIGTALRDGDPYVALASGNGGPWAIVAAAGIPTSDSFYINAGGNVYSLTPTSASFNFANENYSGSIYAGSTLVTGGTSPIDFSSLSSGISNLSSQLSTAIANGMVCSVDYTGSIIPDNGCPSNPIYFNANSQHYNPSWLILYGTDATSNVFNLTQAQFETSTANLDIEAPSGSTTVINVTGANVTLHGDIYFQGSTVTDANAGTILYNFQAANTVTINGQLDGTLLAPNAALSGISQMGGVFLAASIGSTGEAHYLPFTGTLPNSGTAPSTLTVTGPAVTTGEVGAPFNSGPITVTGGTSPDTFTVTGTLLAGLTLNPATGAITGTATTPGTFSVKVTDASGATGTSSPITINPSLAVTGPAVTTGEVGAPFNSGPITVTGGTGPDTFSITGTLPAGLTLNPATGAITGPATTPGTFSVKVTDAAGATGNSSPITINPALAVTGPAVTTGEVGAPFNSGPITVTGGTGPDTFSITGTLPAGLTLNAATGAITGPATTPGTFSVKVTDAAGATGTSSPITINPALAVTSPAVTTGEVGAPFNSGPITVTGGTSPDTFSIVGTLPTGLNLNPATGAITGTATTPGTFSVKVTDAAGGTGTSSPITINPAASLSVTKSADSAIIAAGSTAGYKVILSNIGSTTASGLTLNDPLPAGIGNDIQWTIDPTIGNPSSFSITGSTPNQQLVMNGTMSVLAATTITSTGPTVITGDIGLSPGTSITGFLPGVVTGTTHDTDAAAATAQLNLTAAYVAAAAKTGGITIGGELAGRTLTAGVYMSASSLLNSGDLILDAQGNPNATFTFQMGSTLTTMSGSHIILANGANACNVFWQVGSSATLGTYSVFKGNILALTSITVTTGVNLEGTTLARNGAVTLDTDVISGCGQSLAAGASLAVHITGTTTGSDLNSSTNTGLLTNTATVCATNAPCSQSTAAITLNPALAVTGPGVTTGEVGAAFNSGPLTVSGGTGPDTFSIVGILPAGLTLNSSTGAVTGTPTTAGTFSVKVTDASGASVTGSSITINSALSITGPAVTTGQVGAAFNSGATTVSGGIGPYAFSITGTLPAGLNLNTSTGAVIGTPTTAGTFSVKVTDASGVIGTSSPITIGISPTPSLSITKSADSTGITAGGVAGYTVIIGNVGATSATGLTLSDPLPAGLGGDIQWAIDPTTGNPSAFTITGSAPHQQLVMSGTMSVLAATTITNTGSTVITGDIGLFPGTSVTGFPPGVVTGSIHDADLAASTAQTNLTAAYLAAAGKSGAITIAGDLAGQTFTAGVYQSASSLANSGDLILDAQGNPNATFTFQMGSTLTTITGSHIILANGANACNVFWQVGSSATLGTYSVFKGNILALTSITVTTGVNLEGTALARNGAVTLDTDVITGCTQSLTPGASLAVHITGTTTGNDLNTSTNNGVLTNTATICATNAACVQSTAAITINGNTVMSVTCPTVTSGPLGAPFNSAALTVSGGTGPYTFATVGTLPAGLTLDTSTGAITGTPTTAGSFFIKVTDARGATASTCTFNIGAGYAITVNPSTVTVVAGQTATTTFTFSPYGGYTGTVSFACSGLPAGATCTFSPTSLTANGSNTVQTSMLSITTTANGVATIAQNQVSSSTTLASMLILPGLLLGGLLGWRRRSLQSGWKGMLLITLLSVTLLGGVIGCGTIIYATPAGAKQVTVTAQTSAATTDSSGSTAKQTATFTLIVTR